MKPTDLNKLSDVVDKENVKKHVYEELDKKVKATDPSELVKKQIMML